MSEPRCAHCGHHGLIHFSGTEPDSLTKQTSGCVYHDADGPCLCPGWVEPASTLTEHLERGARIARGLLAQKDHDHGLTPGEREWLETERVRKEAASV